MFDRYQIPGVVKSVTSIAVEVVFFWQLVRILLFFAPPLCNAEILF
jgi:hypothetical protein